MELYLRLLKSKSCCDDVTRNDNVLLMECHLPDSFEIRDVTAIFFREKGQKIFAACSSSILANVSIIFNRHPILKL